MLRRVKRPRRSMRGIKKGRAAFTLTRSETQLAPRVRKSGIVRGSLVSSGGTPSAFDAPSMEWVKALPHLKTFLNW